MAEKITNIKERILLFVDYKGFTLAEFFANLKEIGYGSFRGKSKDSALNSNAVAEIITNFPELNLVWLITGKGEMLVKNRVTRILEFIKVEKIDRKKLAEKSNISSTIINNLEKFEDLDFDILKAILTAFPKINEDWLLYGLGNMFNDSNVSNSKDSKNLVYEEGHNYNNMPFYKGDSIQEIENVDFVICGVEAEYINGGYKDETFLKNLPKFHFPFLSNGTFRSFGVKGHAQKFLKDKDYFVGKKLVEFFNFSEGKYYVIISEANKSLLIKQVFRHPERRDMLILRSDANDIVNTYPDIHIHFEMISEMWVFEAKITFSEPVYDIENFKEILKTNPKHITIDKD